MLAAKARTCPRHNTTNLQPQLEAAAVALSGATVREEAKQLQSEYQHDWRGGGVGLLNPRRSGRCLHDPRTRLPLKNAYTPSSPRSEEPHSCTDNKISPTKTKVGLRAHSMNHSQRKQQGIAFNNTRRNQRRRRSATTTRRCTYTSTSPPAHALTFRSCSEKKRPTGLWWRCKWRCCCWYRFRRLRRCC